MGSTTRKGVTVFFEPHLKLIYSPRGSDKKYDPLAVDRLLTIHTGNRLNELVSIRNALSDDRGDVSVEGRRKAAVEAAQAELTLADASRKSFDLPPFPGCTDAQALETLYDFLGWMEGKGTRVGDR